MRLLFFINVTKQLYFCDLGAAMFNGTFYHTAEFSEVPSKRTGLSSLQAARWSLSATNKGEITGKESNLKLTDIVPSFYKATEF